MYKCKYFKIEELVHPNILKETPENVLWAIFDGRLLQVADNFREKYGPIFINGYGLVDCGLRELNSKTGVKYSAHKFGRALDLHIQSIENKNLSQEEKIEAYNQVRKEYLDEEKHLVDSDYDLSSCINFEKDISWLHIDTYNRPKREFNR